MFRSRARAAALAAVAVLGTAPGYLDAHPRSVPRGDHHPKPSSLRHRADYQLATYRQMADYCRKLDAESDRLTLFDIGKPPRPATLMAIAPRPRTRSGSAAIRIVRRLPWPRGSPRRRPGSSPPRQAVVWIDGGLQRQRGAGPQQLIETSYRLVSGEDDETRRILRDVVILLVHANPDGHDLVADWYLRQPDPQRRSTAGLPRLYQKYIGHDNNRDSYMSTQAESTNMNRVLYREWFPQILYNHHQTGPSGTVLFAPPFRDPFNYVFDPLVPVGIDLVGAAIHHVRAGTSPLLLCGRRHYSTG